MNTVYVSLTEFGPDVLTFESRADNFISIVVTIVEKLRALGHEVGVMDMGHKFFVCVR